MSKQTPSKRFWNRAARDNAAWYIATRFTSESEKFFASGASEVDEFLGFAGLALQPTDTVVEIGSGVGRMTRRLAELAGGVIATDVSGEMLTRARVNLAQVHNVDYVELSGEGDLPLETNSVDAVFSYITMQHVPTAAAQERYFAEALRIVRDGGWVYLQFRRSGLRPRVLDWAGHSAHLFQGRRTFSRSWRGARVREAALLRYASDEVRVAVLPFGGRHIWVLARKAIQSPSDAST